MCLPLIKFYGTFYKYHKSFINYKEKNFKKAAFVLSPAYQLSLSIAAKDNAVPQALYAPYHLNNLGCIAY